MIAQVLEENAAAEQGDLQRRDVDVGVEGAPGICADAVRHEGCEQAVEVEEEEDGEDAAYEQLNQEYPAEISNKYEACIQVRSPIEAVARVQRLRDDSLRHGCTAVCGRDC